ncbi:MAG: hypothetical protein HZA93_23935 [Verrucomicrobia bacterium]|nr:hypothetical protein [Verrucomicrobiota bacterium]
MTIRIQWKSGGWATSYDVYRATTNDSTASTLIASAIAGNSYEDASVADGTTYYYWVKARNSLGTSAFSSGTGGITAGRLLRPPPELTATLTAINEIVLTWAASAGATKYDIYRGATESFGAASVIASNVAALTATDTSADTDTRYFYWVVAKDEAGHSSDPSHATAGYSNVAGPDAPTSVDATVGEAGFIEVTWAAVAIALYYDVYRDGVLLADNITGTSYVDEAMQYHTEYEYRIRAKNYTGYSALSSGATGSANYPVPVAPSGLAATDGIHEVKVRVTWGAVDYANTYKIYRDGAEIDEISGNSYDDIVASGASHTYQVKAVGESGTSGFSNSDTGYAAALSAPTGISATDNTDMDKVTVTWSAVAAADSYNVYRDGTLIASGLTASTYDDTTATVNVGYAYNVKAVVTGVETSAYGTSDNGMRLLISAPTGVAATDTDLDQIDVSWSAATGAASYEVWRDGTQLATGLTGLSYTDSSVTVNVTYSYQIKAVHSASNVSNLSTADNGVRPQLAAPANVQATTTQVGQVTVSWDAQSAATAGFEVYRNAAFLASVSAGVTSYVDSSGSDCVTSTYTVIAKRTGNNSAASSGANGRPVPTGEFCAGGGLSTSGGESGYDQSFTVCGGATLDWYLNASTIKDQLILDIDGGTIVATGCVSGEHGSSYGPLSSGTHTLRVRVLAHCDAGQGGTTGWSIAITCS